MISYLTIFFGYLIHGSHEWDKWTRRGKVFTIMYILLAFKLVVDMYLMDKEDQREAQARAGSKEAVLLDNGARSNP